MKLKSEALRQSILSTTSELLIAQGIDATSTVKIANQLNISQSNIYSYFKNKETLLLAVFKYHQAQLIEALSSSKTTDTRPLSQIDAVIYGLLKFATQHPQSIQIILLFRQHPQIRKQLPTVNENEYFATQFAKIHAYQKQHIIKLYDAEFLAEGVFSLVVNYQLFTLADADKKQSITQADVVALIHGFLLEPIR